MTATPNVNSPLALLVIADDLTGANDAGVQFAAVGIRSIVLADHHVDSLPLGYPVVVVNTESRHVAPAEAAQRVRGVAQLGMSAGARCFYKKTDSTLRGNIGAELEALLEATSVSDVPFVPALPDLGRTTRSGIHYVHDTPIAQTAFSRDPLNPIRHSRVAEALGPQLKLKPCNLRPEESPAEGFRGVAIIDCASTEDLATIARTLAQTGRMRVVSGSVALAKHLVRYLDVPPCPPPAPDMEGPILFVNGSLNERALEQMRRGAQHFFPVQLTPEQLLGESAPRNIPFTGGGVMLYTIRDRSELDHFTERAAQQGLSEDELHLHVAERTGLWVTEMLATRRFRTLLVFGGDTLAGIARASGWRSFVPLAELEPGVSVSVPSDQNLTLISKAGGFGDAEVVNRILSRVVMRTPP